MPNKHHQPNPGAYIPPDWANYKGQKDKMELPDPVGPGTGRVWTKDKDGYEIELTKAVPSKGVWANPKEAALGYVPLSEEERSTGKVKRKQSRVERRTNRREVVDRREEGRKPDDITTPKEIALPPEELTPATGKYKPASSPKEEYPQLPVESKAITEEVPHKYFERFKDEYNAQELIEQTNLDSFLKKTEDTLSKPGYTPEHLKPAKFEQAGAKTAMDLVKEKTARDQERKTALDKKYGSDEVDRAANLEKRLAAKRAEHSRKGKDTKEAKQISTEERRDLRAPERKELPEDNAKSKPSSKKLQEDGPESWRGQLKIEGLPKEMQGLLDSHNAFIKKRSMDPNSITAKEYEEQENIVEELIREKARIGAARKPNELGADEKGAKDQVSSPSAPKASTIASASGGEKQTPQNQSFQLSGALTLRTTSGQVIGAGQLDGATLRQV